MSPGKPLVVHVLPDTHGAGAENQARYLIEEVGSRDAVEQEIAFFGEGRAHDRFEALGIPMRQVERHGRFRTDFLGRARRLRRAYAERPPAILHTWLLEGNNTGLLAARRWPSTAVVITQRSSWNEFDYRLQASMQRLQIKRADHAISNSTGGRDALQKMGMDPTRISVIANGVPTERLRVSEGREAIRARYGWGDDPLAVWVGRADEPTTAAQKDFPTLFDAIERVRREVPRVHLIMVGPTAADLEACGVTAPPSVDPIGWQDAAVNFVNAADAVVISSRMEGHSNVADEALALGVPLVSTNCGDHCALIDGDRGAVVEVGDADGLATSLTWAMSLPRSESAGQDMRRRLSVERMADETLGVYNRFLPSVNRVQLSGNAT